jgi:hypothetical protein
MPDLPPRRRTLIVLLSWAHARGHLVQVGCGFHSGVRYYVPDDLIRLFGDVDVQSLERKMKCSRCGRGDNMEVDLRLPSAAERQRMTIRRLVDIRVKRIPVWRDDAPHNSDP